MKNRLLQFFAAVALVVPVASNAVQPEKITPDLMKRVTQRQSGTEKVLILLKGGAPVPPLPHMRHDVPATDPRNVNILQERLKLIDAFAEYRKREQTPVTKLVDAVSGRVLESFWLVNAVLAEVPRSAVLAISQAMEVEFVSGAADGAPPPTIRRGREITGTDAYRVGGWPSGGARYALIDTGVRRSHTLFVNLEGSYYPPKPNQISEMRDCVNGSYSDCFNEGGPYDPDDYDNHGTASASILTANNRLGDSYWGATDPPSFVSYKVYSGGESDDAATARAFQAAIRHHDELILVEVQSTNIGTVVFAANNAFDAGVGVIAVAGNYGPGAGTIRSPGGAKNVITVGAVNAGTLMQEESQSRGPGFDGRIKPDVQAPTWTTAASNMGDPPLSSFGGTSGAAPYVAAAYGVRLNYWWTAFPGYIYAELIAAGDAPGAAAPNTVGAGVVRLPPPNGQRGRALLTVAQGQQVDTPADLSSAMTATSWEIAIWWSTNNCASSNMALSVIDPSGRIVAGSDLPLSVWEKVRVSPPYMAGTYTIRVTGVSVASPQQVYLASLFR